MTAFYHCFLLKPNFISPNGITTTFLSGKKESEESNFGWEMHLPKDTDSSYRVSHIYWYFPTCLFSETPCIGYIFWISDFLAANVVKNWGAFVHQTKLPALLRIWLPPWKNLWDSILRSSVTIVLQMTLAMLISIFYWYKWLNQWKLERAASVKRLLTVFFRQLSVNIYSRFFLFIRIASSPQLAPINSNQFRSFCLLPQCSRHMQNTDVSKWDYWRLLIQKESRCALRIERKVWIKGFVKTAARVSLKM